MGNANRGQLEAQLEDLRSRLNQSEARLAEELRHNQLLRDISNAQGLEELLTLLGAALERLPGVDAYLIALTDSERDSLVCEAVHLPAEFHSVEATYQHLKFPLDRPDPAVSCLLENRPLVTSQEELQNNNCTTAIRLIRWRMQAAHCLPISLGSRAIGVVLLMSRDGALPAQTPDQARALIDTFRQPVAKAAHHQHLREKEDQLNRAAEAQREFLRFIAQINNLTSTDSIYDLISREFLGRFPFDLVGVLTCQDQEIELRRLSVSKPEHAEVAQAMRDYFADVRYRLDETDGATPMVYLKNSPMFFADAQDILDLPMSDKDRGSLRTLNRPRTIFILPIRRQDTPIGVLWLVSLEEPVVLSPQERDVIELLCAFIGTAMANAELYTTVGAQKLKIEKLNHALEAKVEELRVLASRDPLTGLGNFGAFEAELDRRINEYDRDPNRGLSLLVLDVDHFKHFNDTYGHLAGNMVLQEVARRLQESARSMDMVCRYGGEEFVLLLPKCDVEGAAVVGERVRQAMADTPFPVGREAVTVTLSIGCAAYRTKEGGQAFVQRADEALYQAKRNGRNRVVVTPD